MTPRTAATLSRRQLSVRLLSPMQPRNTWFRVSSSGEKPDRSRAVSEGRTSETTAERSAVETHATEQRFSRSKRFSISSANTDFATSSIVNDFSLQSPLSSSQIHSKKLRFLLQPQLSSLPLQNPSPNKPCLTTRTSSAGNPDRKTRT